MAEIIANSKVVFIKLKESPSKYETFLKDRKSNVIIKCTIESRARVYKQLARNYVLTISSSAIEELNLKESIFGSAAEVFILVTRNQLLELANRGIEYTSRCTSK